MVRYQWRDSDGYIPMVSIGIVGLFQLFIHCDVRNVISRDRRLQPTYLTLIHIRLRTISHLPVLASRLVSKHQPGSVCPDLYQIIKGQKLY